MTLDIRDGRQIHVMSSYDVIVVGGGIAGISAAVAAAREGSRTLIIEKGIVFGGLSTAGLINWYADRDKISNNAMEDAFIRHVGWDKHLPTPYFVKAGKSLIERFEDCTVKGVTISACGFYGPQGRVIRLPLAMPDMVEKFESFRYGEYRITNFEMESSAVAGLARHLGHEAGTVCCAIANRHLGSSNTDYKPHVRGLVKLALDKLTE